MKDTAFFASMVQSAFQSMHGGYEIPSDIATVYPLAEAIQRSGVSTSFSLAMMGNPKRYSGLSYLLNASAKNTSRNFHRRRQAIMSILASTPYAAGYEAFENKLAGTIANELKDRWRHIRWLFNRAGAFEGAADIAYCYKIAAVTTRIMKDHGIDTAVMPDSISAFSLSKAAYVDLTKDHVGAFYPSMLYAPDVTEDIKTAYKFETSATKNVVGFNTHPDADSLGTRLHAVKLVMHGVMHHNINLMLQDVQARHDQGISEPVTPFEHMIIPIKLQARLLESIAMHTGKAGVRSMMSRRMASSLAQKVTGRLSSKKLTSEREILLTALEEMMSTRAYRDIRRTIETADKEADIFKRPRVLRRLVA